jgi:hypothetical protein
MGNNTVLINARTLGTHRVQQVSFDGGETFGPSREAMGLRESLEGCEGSTIAAGGLLFYSGLADKAILRRNISIYTSRDRGDSYQPYRVVDSGPSGYSAMAIMPDPQKAVASSSALAADVNADIPAIGLLYERSKTAHVIFVPDAISFELAYDPTVHAFPYNDS